MLISCSRQTSVDVAAERAALRDADNRYSQNGSAKAADAFLGLYASDAAMYVPEGPIVKGLDSIRSFLDPIFKDPAFVIKFTPVTVEVSQGGDIGYTLNFVQLTSTGPNSKPMTEHVRDFHLWRKQVDGSWKVVVDIWNAEPPTTVSSKK